MYVVLNCPYCQKELLVYLDESNSYGRTDYEHKETKDYLGFMYILHEKCPHCDKAVTIFAGAGKKEE